MSLGGGRLSTAVTLLPLPEGQFDFAIITVLFLVSVTNFVLEFEGMSRILGHVLLSLLVDVSLGVDELFPCGTVVQYPWQVCCSSTLRFL